MTELNKFRVIRLLPWKYDIRRNVNLDFSIANMRKVAIVFFELRVVKTLSKIFN